MDLDLNQEPLDSPHGSMFRLETLLNEMETAHGCIEERIRQLEGVTFRARQRQRWRQNHNTTQTMNMPEQSTATEVRSDGTLLSDGVVVAPQAMTSGARKHVKRNTTHLIAKALGEDTDVKNTKRDTGGFFDCNICLDIAREPILTRCGHLFCWPCFYQLSYVYPNAKECPVCMEEVTDKSIIPIYGNQNDVKTQKSRLKESGLKVPPRPQAQRIESLRQQVGNHRAIFSVIDRNVRLYNMILAMEERSQSENFDGTPSLAERSGFLINQSGTSQALPAMRTEDIQHHNSSQVSRQSFQGSASFSSLSSALRSAMDSVERLVDNLEASIHSRHMRRNHQPSSSDIDRHPFSSIAAATHQNSQMPDNVADLDSMLAHRSSSYSTRGATVVQLENQRMITAIESSSVSPIHLSSLRRRAELSRISEVENSIEDNSTLSYSASTSRRRNEFPGVSEVDNGSYREPRRRRLV